MDEVPSAHKQKIVIVEDNAALADIYKIRLDLIGYDCHIAYDGQEALETIEREKPDLVLLDMMVPKVAGDEILRRMRATDWGKDIKVFVISNLNEVDAPQGLRDLGIEGYVVKANLSNDQLDQLVDGILKPKGQTEDVSLEIDEPQPDMYERQASEQDTQQPNPAPMQPPENDQDQNQQSPTEDNHEEQDHNPDGSQQPGW